MTYQSHQLVYGKKAICQAKHQLQFSGVQLSQENHRAVIFLATDLSLKIQILLSYGLLSMVNKLDWKIKRNSLFII